MAVGGVVEPHEHVRAHDDLNTITSLNCNLTTTMYIVCTGTDTRHDGMRNIHFVFHHVTGYYYSIADKHIVRLQLGF